MLKAWLSRARRALVTTFAIAIIAFLLPPGHAVAGGTKGGGRCKHTCTRTTTTTDTTPPSVAIGSPTAGSTVSGSITVSGTASDNVSVASVAIAVDGGSYALATGTTTWSTTLDTANYVDGSHTLSARATDSSGNIDVVSETITTSTTTATSSPSPSSSPSLGTFTIPSTIDDTGSTDVAPAILSWIAAVPDGSTLVFGAGKTYRVEEVLEITGRNGLTFDGNGSTFISKDAPADQRAMWRTWDCSTMVFKNMNLVGSYSTPGTFNSSLQHAHGIDLRGTSAEIYGLHISDMAGDGVYFGLGQTSALNKSSGSFHDSSVYGTGRNAVSVTAGQNIMVQKVTTDKIGYEVFDVEPNVGTGWGASNVTFDSNTIGYSYEQSFVVIGNEPISNITFSNNSGGLAVYVVGRTFRPYKVVFTGNVVKNTMNAPVFDISYADYPAVTNNTVPIWSGSLIAFDYDCNPTASGNSYPGGSSEDTITNRVTC